MDKKKHDALVMERKKRDEFIMKYAPLVKNIVERVSVKLPSHLNVKEELINVGIIGLISAIEKFDKKRNVKFETYASFRIRGAVLDELRARDWMPRSTRNKYSKLEESFSSLQKILGRPPEEEEMCRYLNVPLHKYYEILDEAKGVTLLSSEDLPPDYQETYANYDLLDRMDQETPFSFLVTNELRVVLKKAIDALPEKERLILSLYYYEELTMKEIGKVVNLTESRVCQLHTQAILRLGGNLKEIRGVYY
ncbi:MAG: FliA/WhiG family RNA polymerase sigma factor [Deltaproteobacteria bacterium]|nr:FliA/WhiG family RNA polymerase sigma factor [Deltaproteobacteria bacterium]